MSSVAILFLLFASANASVRGKGRFASAHEGKDKGNSMIAKIIQMLGEEKDKIQVDIQTESKTMADYMQYCDDDQSEKAYAIKTATRKTAELEALVADNTAQINSLEEEIMELGAEIAERQEEMDTAKKVRDQEHVDFKAREAEQMIIVEEMDKMMIELKHQMAAMTTPPPVSEEEAAAAAEGEAGAAGFIQDSDDSSSLAASFAAESLLQKNVGAQINRHTPLTQEMLHGANMPRLLKIMEKAVSSFSADIDTHKKGDNGAFMQQSEDPLAGLGQAAGGENSGPVVEEEKADPKEQLAAFGGLKKKAEKALQKERDGEVNAQQAFSMNKQALTDQINLAKYKEEDCKKDKMELSEEKAEAEKEIATIAETKAADEKYLKKLVNECTASSHAWDVRQSEAKAEMAAIEKAKEILASRVTVFAQTEAATVTKKHQQPSPPADMQLAKTRQTLINHFRSLGNRLKSLSMLNMVSVASAQPMDKVKGLISDLIAKLEKEAAEAADTHAFCQEEKTKNDAAIKKHGDKIDLLTARLDKANAKKSKLAQDVEELTAEVAAIAKSQEEATSIRNEEKATFTKAFADFTEAADAVQDAIDALKDYYGDASFVQVGHKQPQGAPALGGAKKDSSNVIVGMLETMGQEFAKTAADLEASEHEAVEAYKALTQENTVAKNAKETEIIGAKSEIATLDVAIGHSSDDKKMTEKELAAVHEYVLSLKPTCYGRVVSYAERKAKRDAEIEGLKEAVQILEESSPSLIQLRR
eukprot:gnl/MRDRNA2_/MRDRNA2_89650_c0_seq1.p1 gnl/MRDRNA2_/MRDRNA2_89650_c0~~gnl/MRDRNA2_/MRDRNA2_89650_c0_seq1.p1  ORF type:complete len:758 (+),score=294.23 gnl/MRDRNA2_/MRDRNA2_89650_c0_seq1:99-2372(+)